MSNCEGKTNQPPRVRLIESSLQQNGTGLVGTDRPPCTQPSGAPSAFLRHPAAVAVWLSVPLSSQTFCSRQQCSSYTMASR